MFAFDTHTNMHRLSMLLSVYTFLRYILRFDTHICLYFKCMHTYAHACTEVKAY